MSEIKEAKKATKKRPKKMTKKIKEVELEKAEEIKKVEKTGSEKYYQGVGRRKTAVARVRLFTRRLSPSQPENTFLVNERPLEKYFPTFELQNVARASLEKMNCLDRFRILVTVRGGGSTAQAEATRHGLAKALVIFNPNFQKRLRKAGLLTRDSRVKERKKFGLKRARRAREWSKR